MPQSRTAPQVGAPDPEASNSPIFDEDDDDYLSLDLELEASACYFNGQSYRIGDYVCSGTELHGNRFSCSCRRHFWIYCLQWNYARWV